jgi:hypothetical protein
VRLVVPKPADAQLARVNIRLFAAKGLLCEEFEASLEQCYDGYDDAAMASGGSVGAFASSVSLTIDPELANSVTQVKNKHKTLELEVYETGAKSELKMKKMEAEMVQMKEIINRLVNGGGGAAAASAAAASGPYSPRGDGAALARYNSARGNLHFTQSKTLDPNDANMADL